MRSFGFSMRLTSANFLVFLALLPMLRGRQTEIYVLETKAVEVCSEDALARTLHTQEIGCRSFGCLSRRRLNRRRTAEEFFRVSFDTNAV